MRAVPEWIGKTPDSAVPPRVRARVFLKWDGQCHLSGRRINPGDEWQCDHIVAICNGGQNVESNLAPALVDKHREKTVADVAEKSKVAKKRLVHLGLKKSRNTLPGGRHSKWKKRLSGEVVLR